MKTFIGILLLFVTPALASDYNFNNFDQLTLSDFRDVVACYARESELENEDYKKDYQEIISLAEKSFGDYEKLINQYDQLIKLAKNNEDKCEAENLFYRAEIIKRSIIQKENDTRKLYESTFSCYEEVSISLISSCVWEVFEEKFLTGGSGSGSII